MPCEHGVEFKNCSTISCLRKNITAFLKSENDIRIRLQKQFGVEPAEVKAIHRADILSTVLSLLPEDD